MKSKIIVCIFTFCIPLMSLLNDGKNTLRIIGIDNEHSYEQTKIFFVEIKNNSDSYEFINYFNRYTLTAKTGTEADTNFVATIIIPGLDSVLEKGMRFVEGMPGSPNMISSEKESGFIVNTTSLSTKGHEEGYFIPPHKTIKVRVALYMDDTFFRINGNKLKNGFKLALQLKCLGANGNFKRMQLVSDNYLDTKNLFIIISN